MKNTIISLSLLIALLLLIAGCSSPQERKGISPIPFNSPDQSDTDTFDGSF